VILFFYLIFLQYLVLTETIEYIIYESFKSGRKSYRIQDFFGCIVFFS